MPTNATTAAATSAPLRALDRRDGRNRRNAAATLATVPKIAKRIRFRAGDSTSVNDPHNSNPAATTTPRPIAAVT